MPYRCEVRFRNTRAKALDHPKAFRLHELRHYFAALLIAGGLDIKTVQKRVRYVRAKRALDEHGRMFSGKHESARAVIADAMRLRADSQISPDETLAD